ncbi:MULTISPECIES: hypothetical protein [unclassified Pseudomonas]|uniref:Uncharacterized protein n=1 Tax=Pseudomonas machongensis TaxID=3110229 RepID=A0ABU5VM17_9PSED|nr:MULTISPECIES: hypothetical protein [unclassified Pseudomonas]MBC3423556.1 hypothetical protein [Pseudomonas sp. RW3S2]MBC3464644.1 hypothetical protein [Pseudomonas sp. RW10S2]MEA5674428.1 hypothetical protein [Pseudomonas sp. MH2]
MRIEPRPLLPSSTEKTPSVEAVRPLQARPNARFDALLGKREVAGRRSLRAELEQACAGEEINPDLFSGTRALDLLQYLLDEVMPSLDAEPEIRDLAEDLLREEIHLRQSLEQQRAEVQEP